MQQYDSYIRWKEWSTDFSISKQTRHYFEMEFGGAISSGQQVIEIGFGSGGFLVWAREKGVNVLGVELQEELVFAANKHGFTAVDKIEKFLHLYSEKIDYVVALDVFEHLSSIEIEEIFKTIDALLRNGGALIIRVPNGGSPFGLWNQYGDATHINVITPAKLRQLSVGTSLRVVSVKNQARVLPDGTVGQKIRERLIFIARDLINRLIARIYGFENSILDQNIIVVLQKIPVCG